MNDMISITRSARLLLILAVILVLAVTLLPPILGFARTSIVECKR